VGTVTVLRLTVPAPTIASAGIRWDEPGAADRPAAECDLGIRELLGLGFRRTLRLGRRVILGFRDLQQLLGAVRKPRPRIRRVRLAGGRCGRLLGLSPCPRLAPGLQPRVL
jgi:hypothetical protein